MCQGCEWEDLIERIDEMLDEEKYEWAADTLEGIRGWVARNEHCTDKQKQAVDNIEEAAAGRS
ncbi:MAG: hypothetical protein ABFD92_16640 [Planctomycetaceae bacterium]|nr:hypothetical protein [Planctomycetaceae bacterium]